MNDQVVYIDVAIPLPIGGLFTYSAPGGDPDVLRIGRRVLVPFRNKIRAGFIAPRDENTAPPKQIKAVTSIPDEAPYFGAGWWEFVKWAADYYFVPLGLMLKTALPPNADRKSVPWAVITEEGKGPLSESPFNVPAEALARGKIRKPDLIKIIGESGIRDALKASWLRIEERIAAPKIRKTPWDRSAGRTPEDSDDPVLTPHQDEAVRRLTEAVVGEGFKPFLLYGVTGSGKTEVYIRVIREVLRLGKQALVLVPEIALTPQLAGRFTERLPGPIGVFHSGFTPAQRATEWRRVVSGELRTVIAARSGIFQPFEQLGVIIVDEEHDSSYKQSDGCPYNARDLALARGKLQQACVILGSATPSFETYLNARTGKITRIDLPERYHGGNMPKVRLVDLRAYKTKKTTLLTPELIDAVGRTLADEKQAVLFLNRRGYDTFSLCRACGHVFKCPNCDVSLTHHKSAAELRCHMCGFARQSPPLCPQCQSEKIFFGGAGTQKVEEELAALFPAARIERLDRDSTRKRGELEGILGRFRHREIDILTGTQMLVTGHDFPGITLVGVLCGDASLHFPDFRSGERTFQMLTQVSGRTGRDSDAGSVIIQTYDPEHMSVKLAAEHAYEPFFESEAALRAELLYPPFGRLILIRIEGTSDKKVERKAAEIARSARLMLTRIGNVAILGPAPAPRQKLVGKFRRQVLLKSATRGPLRALVRGLIEEGKLKGEAVKVTVDVDPMDML